jgi:transcriptional regulator of arginine metabolism
MFMHVLRIIIPIPAPELCVKERLTRLKAVRKFIKTNRIESQETLLGHLQKEGFLVTQATLSRDLKFLKVGKIADGNNGYIYSLPGEEEQQESARTYSHDFLRGYVSIEWSGSIVVIKTYSGHSDSVALAVDNLGLDDVLGTIAGRDNTVFVALREGVTGWICDERRGSHLIPLVKKIPRNKLLLETDAPYLMPRNMSGAKRNGRNESRYLVHIANFIAAILEKDPAELAAETFTNTCTFFNTS